MESITLKNILEAALLTADEPLAIERLQKLFTEQERPAKNEIQEILTELMADYQDRGVELVQRGDRFHYQSRVQLAPWLRRMTEGRAPRYSRALLETLAIIAYHQPVSRGDIEEIRGVSVSSETIRTLLQRDWIQQIGYRDVPGRPGLFGTTQGFLAYFGLTSLQELPQLREPRDPEEIALELNLRTHDVSIDIGTAVPSAVDGAMDEKNAAL
ncbi:MAG TPA: SMC-Scp complex subunit ScpB [Gammaproteobacteria bacterium]|nr:SMC-Scp complex subunit ScpB [Gammaproteobacteria bacterium]